MDIKITKFEDKSEVQRQIIESRALSDERGGSVERVVLKGWGVLKGGGEC